MSIMNEEEYLRREIERLQQASQMTAQQIFAINQAFPDNPYQTKRTYTETDLNNAVECENYELAAIIRDELNNK